MTNAECEAFIVMLGGHNHIIPFVNTLSEYRQEVFAKRLGWRLFQFYKTGINFKADDAVARKARVRLQRSLRKACNAMEDGHAL